MGWIKFYDKQGRLVEHIGDPDPLDEKIEFRSLRKEDHPTSWKTDGNDPDQWGE